MRQYSTDPKGAVFVRRITGINDSEEFAELLVTRHRDTYYTTWMLDDQIVYRRQYSGRNVADLDNACAELLAGLHNASEQH